jgi:hypothetical protein
MALAGNAYIHIHLCFRIRSKSSLKLPNIIELSQNPSVRKSMAFHTYKPKYDQNYRVVLKICNTPLIPKKSNQK